MRSTLGRWTRLAGLPAAAVVAMALVATPAFAAASTPTPPGCVIITPADPAGAGAQPDHGKPGKCVICIITAPGGGTTGGGTTGTAGGTIAGTEQGTTTSAGGQGTVTAGRPGKPGECPVCPLPPWHPTTGSGQGAGTVATQPGKGKECTICIITKPDAPGATPAQPVPGDPAKCEIHSVPTTK
ncbi:hypothetical protein [Kutzneria sp. CA-103260]|uniref:hypothetical protein n=1 Tax=Kutzneria sp. CA-103260 TaxID=2802641 RepID=UPI001BA818D0|nr:hypothetical protein [Kutzneria sp. CA-103260]QUQ65812.1 hypothetical protein JJ691_35370 [Kutzneria sp. CA-103260]